MNSLDATVTKVGSIIWDNEYQTYRVEIEYNCWGSISTTEKWFKTLEQAERLRVGSTITV